MGECFGERGPEGLSTYQRHISLWVVNFLFRQPFSSPEAQLKLTSCGLGKSPGSRAYIRTSSLTFNPLEPPVLRPPCFCILTPDVPFSRGSGPPRSNYWSLTPFPRADQQRGVADWHPLNPLSWRQDHWYQTRQHTSSPCRCINSGQVFQGPGNGVRKKVFDCLSLMKFPN